MLINKAPKRLLGNGLLSVYNVHKKLSWINELSLIFG